jgi:hypothetical protein
MSAALPAWVLALLRCRTGGVEPPRRRCPPLQLDDLSAHLQADLGLDGASARQPIAITILPTWPAASRWR